MRVHFRMSSRTYTIRECPRHNSTQNITKAIDTEQLHRVFVEWMKNAVERVTSVVAVDGKQARRTKGGKKKLLHVV